MSDGTWKPVGNFIHRYSSDFVKYCQTTIWTPITSESCPLTLSRHVLHASNWPTESGKQNAMLFEENGLPELWKFLEKGSLFVMPFRMQTIIGSRSGGDVNPCVPLTWEFRQWDCQEKGSVKRALGLIQIYCLNKRFSAHISEVFWHFIIPSIEVLQK